MEGLPTYEAAMAGSTQHSAPPQYSDTPFFPPLTSEVPSTSPIILEELPEHFVTFEEVPEPFVTSEASATSSTPSEACLTPTIPSELSEKLSTFSISSEVPTSVTCAKPATPPELLEDLSEPPIPSQVTSSPAATSKELLETCIASEESSTSEELLATSIIHKEPLPPEELSTTSNASKVPFLSEEPSEPEIISKVPSAPPEPLTSIPNMPQAMPPPYMPQDMPPPYTPLASSSMPQATAPSFGSLMDETMKKAVFEYAETNFKNGLSFVESMSFLNKQSFYSMHYKLETFIENRESSVKYNKCDGKAIDGPSNGPEPDIRSVFVVCREKFCNGETRVVIPHSEHLRTCRKCDDRGKEYCETCKGAGWIHCTSCGGTGYLKDRSACLTCNKSGRLICDPCYSCGKIKCLLCGGYKKTKSYKELKVTWTNHVDEFHINPTDIPIDILKSSTGSEIFCEESSRVQPLTLFPEAAINIASLKLVLKHQKDCADKVILLQRHIIRAIPITKINYIFKGKRGEFYVCGTENRVYFKDVPDMLN